MTNLTSTLIEIRVNITESYLPRPSHWDRIYRHWTEVFGPTLEVWSPSKCPSPGEPDNIPPQRWTPLFWQAPQMLLCPLKRSVNMHIVKLKTVYSPIDLIPFVKYCWFTHYMYLIQRNQHMLNFTQFHINLWQVLALSNFSLSSCEVSVTNTS